jgi:E3 ubiquitin-protein ligase BOI-like protein
LNWVCLIKTGNSTNPRKRGRETSVATEITPSMIPFSLQQSQPPQLIDLSQLHNHNHNHHPNVVSTGLRLSFGEQQQQQQLQQHHHNQQQQNCHSSSSMFSVLAEDFATQIKQQRDELDQFLQAQVIIFTLLRLVYRNFESSRMGCLEFFFTGQND